MILFPYVNIHSMYWFGSESRERGKRCKHKSTSRQTLRSDQELHIFISMFHKLLQLYICGCCSHPFIIVQKKNQSTNQRIENKANKCIFAETKQILSNIATKIKLYTFHTTQSRQCLPLQMLNFGTWLLSNDLNRRIYVSINPIWQGGARGTSLIRIRKIQTTLRLVPDKEGSAIRAFGWRQGTSPTTTLKRHIITTKKANNNSLVHSLEAPHYCDVQCVYS